MSLKENWSRRSSRSSAFLCLLIVCAFYLAAISLWSPPRELTIGLGFFALFVIPGFLLGILAFRMTGFDILERYPLSIILSLGVWAFPGLIAFYFEMELEHVLSLYLAVILFLILGVILFGAREDRDRERDPGQKSKAFFITALVSALGLSVLAYFLQAQRGLGLDWDFFNYISQVRKLAECGLATNAHFAYKGAPVDPIHSYNIWALNWALIAHFGRLDPIELYLNSSFLTVPAALLAFYSLAKKILAPGPALAAFLLFVSYHVIYSGLHFLSTTTFYPADSMWLVAFPASVSLLIQFINQGKGRTAVILALSVLGISMIHVLWGLAFYLTAVLFLIAYLSQRGDLLGLIKKASLLSLWLAVFIFAIPLVAALIWFIIMAGRERPNWHEPLVGSFPGDSLALYALVFLAVPFILLIWAMRPVRAPRAGGLFRGFAEAFRKNTFTEPPRAARVMALVALALIVSIPYILLRWKAIQFTQWQSFGVNPYRGLITANLFLLNPFQRSFTNPNMSFYPLFFLGYLALPWLFKYSGSFGDAGPKDPVERHPGGLLALAVLVAVPLIVLHPVLASLFAKFFSLGYLRRILRLAALFSFFPTGILIARIFRPRLALARGPVLYLAGVAFLSAILALASIPFPARPSYYNHVFGKMLDLMKPELRDSLLYDDTPFRYISETGASRPGEVIFSDLYTSFRLTAYLNNYVVAQLKPGVGVPDQDVRLTDERDFFSIDSRVEKMRRILEKYNATLIIINRNPGYRLYNYPCGHPEAVGRLNQAPEFFEKIFDKGDWVIFRYLL